MLFYVNFFVLSHSFPKESRVISQDEAIITEGKDGSTDISFLDPEGVDIHKFTFDLVSAQGKPVNVCVSVVSSAGSTLIEDKNPAYLGYELINLNLEHVSFIHIESDAGAANFRIDNSLDLTPKALICGALFASALALLILLKKYFVLKPETAFLIISLSMGLSMVVSLPVTKVSYDEEAHLREVYAIAMLPNRDLSMSKEMLYELTVTDFNDPDALPSSAEESASLEKTLDALCVYGKGESTPDFDITISRIPAYLSMAIGARIAMALSFGFGEMIYMIRLFNLMTFIALMYFAIKTVPRARPFMMFIGLLPQVLFMASACSYDPFVIGAVSLGYAFMLRGRRYFAPMLFCLVLGCMVKAVYAPMLLMGIPVVLGKKREAQRKKIIFSLICISVFIALMAVFILPTVLDPSIGGDTRGGNVSEISQVSFILSSPLSYLSILIPQMISWAGKCFAGPDAFTFMGHLVNGETLFKGYYQIYILMLAMLFILSYLSGIDPDIRERVYMLLLVIISSVLIWTAMFVAFTEPGATEIAGVQGRYFIPLMFPLYYALSGHGKAHAYPGRLARGSALCYDLWVFMEFFVLALSIWRVSLSVFCI